MKAQPQMTFMQCKLKTTNWMILPTKTSKTSAHITFSESLTCQKSYDSLKGLLMWKGIYLQNQLN